MTRTTLAALVAVVLGAGVLAPDLALAQVGDVIDPATVVALTNQSRTKARLAPLTVSAELTAAARAKLDDMLRRHYFEHVTPDGRKPWWFITAAGYRIRFAGENLAKGYFSETDLQHGWMKSHGHRNNILGKHYTEIGVAARHDLVVVMFARPID